MRSNFYKLFLPLCFVVLIAGIKNGHAQYCTSNLYFYGCQYGDYIDNVSIGGISQTSTGCASGSAGYSDYTSLSANMEQGSTYTLTVTTGNYGQYVAMWIDLNDNQVFESSEKLVSYLFCSAPFTNYSASFILPVTAIPGDHRMRVRSASYTFPLDPCLQYYYGEVHDYTAHVIPPSNMNFVSSTSTQTNFTTTSSGSLDVEILGIQVVTSGSLNPQSATSFTINSNGSTNFSTDVTNVKIYYTGTSPVFSTASLFGSAANLSSPITGSQELAQGTNFFWVAYDLSASIPVGNYIDAECTQLVLSGAGAQTPSVTAPVGNRQVNYCLPTNTYGCYFAYIDDVILNTLYNVDTYCNGSVDGYVFYAPTGTLTTTLEIGSNYALTLDGPAFEPVGFGVWIDFNNDADFSDAGEFVYSTPTYAAGTQYGNISIPNNTAYIGDHRMRVRAKDYGIVSSSESCTIFSYGEAEDYEITIGPATNMVYASSTVTQNNTGFVTTGALNVEIIGIQVTTQGALDPFNLTSLTINSNGSTNFPNDVSGVKVYYSGTSPVFSTATLFGSGTDLSTPITGNVVLSSGTNYFWVTYDVNTTAIIGDELDAECTQIEMSGAGGTQVPSVTAPTGSRQINYCIPSTTYGCYYGYIDDVVFNTLSNIDTYCNGSANGYINYAPSGSLTTSVEQGGIYSIVLEGGPSYDYVAFGVWIDFNNDGDFDDADEFVFSSPYATYGVQTGFITIPNNASYIGDRRMRIRSKEYSTISASESCNLFLFYYGESEDYTISITPPTAMTYVSSTTTQNNVDPVSLGVTDVEIMGIQVQTSGSLSPFAVTSLTINSNGCTDFTGDVTNVKVYYSGATSSFSTATLFGSSPDLASPITGNQTLLAGTNYFWVTYDLSTTGSMGDFLDAECTQIIMSGGGGTEVPLVTAPTGYRVIDYCTPNNIYNCYFAYIDGVQINTLSNTSTYCNGSVNGYINYAPSGSLTTSLAEGENYTLTLTGSNYEYEGFGVWIDYNNDGDFDDAGEFVYSSPYITAGVQTGSVTIPSDPGFIGDRRMRVRAKDYSLVYSYESCTDFYYGEAEDYTVTITPAVSSMTYISSMATQNDLTNLDLGEQDAPILGIQLVTSGALTPFNATSFTINSTGSSNFSNDVTNVEIYYTGNSPVFSATTLFGSAANLSSPITGSQLLSTGTNYFWVTYDISPNAALGDYVDAECTQIIMDGAGGTQTPSITAPFGSRQINLCVPTYGTLCSSGDYIDIFVFNTLANYYSGCNGNINNYIYYDPGTFTTTVQAGGTYDVTLQSGPSYGQGFGVWIDFNNNGDFGDPGEFVYASPSSGTQQFNGTITLPVDPAYYGDRRMRVRCVYASTLTAIDYCTSNFYYGEIEDYMITIDPPPACSGTPVAGIVSADPPLLCTSGGSTTLTVAGYSAVAGLEFQWQSSPDGSSWSDISGATNSNYDATVVGSTYYRMEVTCTSSGQSASSPGLEVKVGGNEQITSSTGATICGLGTVDLQATTSSDYVLWYADATGGSPLSYSPSPSVYSPFINNTTTYYAAAATGFVNVGNVGPVDYSIGITNQYYTYSFEYFNVFQNCVLEGVYVYPASPGNVVIEWTDQFYNLIQSATVLVTAADVNQKTWIPLNFNLTPGTNYHLAWGFGSVNMYSNDYNSSGYAYPFEIDDVLSITQSSVYSIYYYMYFYDWKVNYSELCESPVRTPVVATVTPAPALTVTPDPGTASLCNGSGQAVTLTATGPYTSFTWSPPDGLNTTSGSIVEASPTASTTYVLNATDGTCNNSDTIAVSVVEPPQLTVTATPDALCSGGTSQLFASTPALTYNVQEIPFAPDPGSGTSVILSDDEESAAFPIGFNFNFYGNDYSDFHISSNGFITFDPFAGSGCCEGQFLPFFDYPNNLIAMAWEDFNPSLGGTVSYYTTGAVPFRKLVVKFDNVQHYLGGDAATMQAILYETTNIIEVHITSMPGNPSGTWLGHTEGIENADGTLGVAVPGRNADPTWTATNDAWRFAPATYVYSWTPSNTLDDPSISNPVASPTSTTTYTVTVTDNASLCSSTGFATVNLLSSPNTGVIVAPATEFCGSGLTTMTLDGYSPGATIQWANSLTGGGPYSDIPGATSDSYTTPSLTTTTYYVAKVTCANQVTSPEEEIKINYPPNSPVGIDGGHCGPGTVELSANGSGTGDLNWYYSETGNTFLGSGSPFTTPYILQTTTFWVEEGLPTPPPLATSYTGYYIQNGSMFDITAINDVYITNFDVNLYFGSSDFEIYYKPGTYVGSETYPSSWILAGSAAGVPSAGFGVPTPIPANMSIHIPAGETYGFYVTSTNYNYLYYEYGSAVGTVLSSDANIQVKEGASNYYPFGYPTTTTRFNGTVHYIAPGCSSPRVAVEAQIYSPQVTAVSTANDICQGETIELIAENSTPGNFTFEWSPAIPGMVPQDGMDDTVAVAPPVTMTFTVSVTDVTGGCDTSVAVVINVNPTPGVYISGLNPQYYDADPPVTLIGVPPGGTFSGPGVTGNLFSPGAVGTGGPYTITYTFTDANGCTGSSSQDVYVVALEGIAGFTDDISLMLYPNPTEGWFTLDLQLTDPAQKVVVRVLNLVGQVIYENDLGPALGELKKTFDFTEYAASSYYVQVIIDGKAVYRKLTIQK